MTNLKNLGARATADFIAHLDEHLNRINWHGNRSDYILTALVEKMASELDDDIPNPKPPHGVRPDALPQGWKSRLYADRYELVVDADLNVMRLHESYGIPQNIPFPRRRGRWWDEIRGQFVQANVYYHHCHKQRFDETALVWKAVYAYLSKLP